MNNVADRNYKVNIDPKTRNVSVSFKSITDDIPSNNTIMGYLLVLAKYDSSLNKIGHLNAKISTEGLNASIYLDQLDFDNVITTTVKTALLNKLKMAVYTTTDLYTTFYDPVQEDLDLKPFLKLLEMVYDEKYYKHAFQVSGIDPKVYNTSILDLYDDFRTINAHSMAFPENISNYTNDINNIVTTNNVNDRNLIIIKTNKNMVSAIRTAINNTNDLNIDLTNFITKYLNKYERLSPESVENVGNGICNADGVCSYVFQNLDDKDLAGNFYYYKLGVGLIYLDTTNNRADENVSNIYTYKYGPGGRMMYFKLDNSLEEQERLIRRLEEIQRNSILSQREVNKPQQQLPSDNDDEASDMNAYMKMLEPHIGNYPDEFVLREQDVRDLSLSDYLNKRLSRGTLNVGVKINELNVQNTTTS
jgi:hypothetical protein